jgi:hypothetical protein
MSQETIAAGKRDDCDSSVTHIFPAEVTTGPKENHGGKDVDDKRPNKTDSIEMALQAEPPASCPATLEAPAKAAPPFSFSETFNRARIAANKGDERAKRAIRECLCNSPGICAKFGNVAQHVERVLVERISGGRSLDI